MYFHQDRNKSKYAPIPNGKIRVVQKDKALINISTEAEIINHKIKCHRKTQSLTSYKDSSNNSLVQNGQLDSHIVETSESKSQKKIYSLNNSRNNFMSTLESSKNSESTRNILENNRSMIKLKEELLDYKSKNDKLQNEIKVYWVYLYSGVK